MKKTISLILACIVTVAGIFAACSSDKSKNPSTTGNGTSSTTEADDEYILEPETVTDKNGKAVTDKDGNAVTTVAQYHVVTDKNGHRQEILVDNEGKDVTDSKGNKVTRPSTSKHTTKVVKVTDDNGKPVTDESGKQKTSVVTEPGGGTTSSFKTTTTKKPTSAIQGGSTTESVVTTLDAKDDDVPKTSAKGKTVEFSTEDQQIIQNMLEVPYLYNAGYENSDGVPTNIAAHVAIWMAQREGLNTTTYASGTIVLDLFKYFGQTVVNFKTQCNSKKDKNCEIKYNSNNDSFTIKKAESKQQSVKIKSIQYLGNNNYYKVTGSVTNAGNKKSVIAIIQKNRLDTSLGFSIKALKWS